MNCLPLYPAFSTRLPSAFLMPFASPLKGRFCL
jgi:hypothetical protein